jgi:hypothetical protein
MINSCIRLMMMIMIMMMIMTIIIIIIIVIILVDTPNSMEQSPPWETGSSAAGQQILWILWNKKFHHLVHRSPPHVPILSQMKPVHGSTTIPRKPVLILFPDLHLALLSGLLLSVFATKTLYAPFFFPTHFTYPARLILSRLCSTHTHHGQICCHNTDHIHVNGHDRTIIVILAKHCIKLSDDGSLVIRNMLGAILNIFKYFTIILIVSTNYIFVHLLDNKMF